MNNQNQNENNEWSKRDIGALWRREGKNQKYLSGYLKLEDGDKEVKIIVFSNKNKNNNEKAPDYRIYISKPLENPNSKSTPTNQPARQKPVATQKKAVVSEVETEEDLL